MANTAVKSGHGPVTEKPLYVFEAPVRLWHWTHTLSIVVLCATGYFIAYPLPSLGGEASEHFVMGNMRLIHFIAAYVFAIGFAVRIYWAFVGNKYSRELFILPIWRGSWWRDFFHEVRFYLFLTRTPPRTIGHNPLAQTAMWFFNFILTLLLIFTGFALYGEGLGAGSWADRWFGWVIPMMGDSLTVKMWHFTGMWLIIVFAIIHIYMAVRADIMGRESSISTIFGGWRFFK
jgi:Ni/Fe-hydrogenase 1 B-type cytochrome subunit